MSDHKAIHSALTRVRPAQLGDLLTRVLRVRRTLVRSNTGHCFLVDPVSVLGMHLLSAGVHEPQMTRLLLALVGPTDVFIDIGGNEGYFSVIAASQVHAGAVHCIEPQTRLRESLRNNFDLNGSKVTVHECAVSNHNGYVDLFLRPSTNTGASSMFRHWTLGSKVERVPCVTLDSFFDTQSLTKARLIKIDCEGAEPLIIRGSKNVLEGHRAEFIAMEYHGSICGSERCRDAHRQIIAAGYVLTTVSGQWIYHLPSYEDVLRPLGDVAINACFT